MPSLYSCFCEEEELVSDEEKSASVLRLQICSDLHIEFFKKDEEVPPIIEPAAPYLALLGDIGFSSNLHDLYSCFRIGKGGKIQRIFAETG